MNKDLIAFKCIKCGHWSGKQIQKAKDISPEEYLKRLSQISGLCKFCGKQTKIRDKRRGDFNTSVFLTDNYKILQLHIQEKNRIFMTKNTQFSKYTLS